jgi:hypothetical protein
MVGALFYALLEQLFVRFYTTLYIVGTQFYTMLEQFLCGFIHRTTNFYAISVPKTFLRILTINVGPRCILGGGRRRSQKMTGGAHSSRPGGTRGGSGWHPPEGSYASLCAGVFWCLPDSSSVVFIAGKFHLLYN